MLVERLVMVLHLRLVLLLLRLLLIIIHPRGSSGSPSNERANLAGSVEKVSQKLTGPAALKPCNGGAQTPQKR